MTTTLAWPRPGKDTGQGRVTQLLRTQPGDARSRIIDDYWLWNFNFDGNVPKPAHERTLDTITKTLRRRPSHLHIIGFADKAGNVTYNQKLSESRALMVKKWFLSRGLSEGQIPGTRMSAYGEAFSQNTKAFAKNDKERDAYYRAVNVQVHVNVLNKPIDIPEPIDPTLMIEWHWWKDVVFGRVPKIPRQTLRDDTTPSRRWSVKYYEGYSVSAGASLFGVGGGAMMQTSKIVLYNHETRLHHVARITSSGLFGGVDPVPSINGMPVLPGAAYTDGASTWTTFDLSEPRSYKDFEGDVEWHAHSVEDATLVPAGVNEPIRVPTGWTYGTSPVAGESSRGILNITPGVEGINDRP